MANGTITVTAGATLNTNGFSTAATILNRVAKQVGLVKADYADPYDGLNANFVRLGEYLNTVGDDLTREFDWQQLLKEATFTTDGATYNWDLPADYNDFQDQSGWNRSTRFPLLGPLTQQEAQFLKARLPNVLVNVTFRIQDNVLNLPILPPTGQVIAFEYQSRYWVKSAGASAADKAAPTVSTDVCLLDPLLLVRGVKLEYIKNGGPGDVVSAQRDYDKTLEYCIGKNTGAPILNLQGGQQRMTDRFLNGDNIPITGFGQ